MKTMTTYLAFAGIKEKKRKRHSNFYSFYSSPANIKNAPFCLFAKKMRGKCKEKKEMTK
jgi:hypothetical protein